MSKLCAYVIAIESVEERASNARRLIGSLATDSLFDEVSLHPAIYWKNRGAVIDYLLRHLDHTFTESYLDECLMGQLAVTLSHISAWRRLLESDHDGAAIFEDDIEVTDMPTLRNILSRLREDDAEWVRLHLFRTFRDDIIAAGQGEMFIDDPQPWGFAAYYVSRSGAKKLLEHCREIERPVDFLPPELTAKGVFAGKTVTQVVVDLEPFEGDVSELSGRSSLDTLPSNLQKLASTIYNSPRVADDAELRAFLSTRTRHPQPRLSSSG